jgi:hypothetical protein
MSPKVVVIARPVSFGFAQDMVWAEAISAIMPEIASQKALAMTVIGMSLTDRKEHG